MSENRTRDNIKNFNKRVDFENENFRDQVVITNIQIVSCNTFIFK